MAGGRVSLVTSWPLDAGIGSGVAEVAKTTAQALKAAGYKPDLISASYSSRGYLTSSLSRILFNLKLSPPPEPVVAFDFDGFNFPPSLRFASVNGGALADILPFESGVIKTALTVMAALEGRACRKAAAVFTPSEYAKGAICRHYRLPPEKVRVMPNGIDFRRWTELVGKAERDINRPPTVLAVARLYKRKGLMDLLAAWPGVLKRVPDARLRIVGDGLERPELEEAVYRDKLEASVTFAGEVTPPERTAVYYANSDVFCLPSRHETFGLVFLEAMAAAKPVVALNTTATPEVVRHRQDGILVPPDDREALADAVAELLENPSTAFRMGESGRERVKERFDRRKVIEPLTEWLEEKHA